MTSDDNGALPLGQRVATAAPFDQVAIFRWLGKSLPAPGDVVVEGEGAAAVRLAELVSGATADPGVGRLDPADARALVAMLLPIALSDPSLAQPLAAAAERHVQDESMNAIEVLSDAVAIALVLIVATTEIEWKAGKCVRIVKRSLSDKTLLKLVKLLERVIGQKA